MNKKNLGVIITSSTLVAAAIGGGIAAVVQAEDRSNAYAPTTSQKQRLSLLDTFLNNDDQNEAGTKEKFIDNPFALFAKDKIEEIAKELLTKHHEFAQELGYTAGATLPDDFINEMSLLRLDKNEDTILIQFNKSDGKTVYKKRLLKLNINVLYDSAKLKQWGQALEPKAIINMPDSELTTPLDIFDTSLLTDVKAKFESADADQRLLAMDEVVKKYPSNKQGVFSKSILQTLILWKIYGLDQTKIGSFKTMGDLKNYIIAEQAKDSSLTEEVDKKFKLFAYPMQFFPMNIQVAGTAEIINSDMDLIKTIQIPAGNVQSQFDAFEKSVLIGLELFPDSALEGGIFETETRNHRTYSSISAVSDSGEEDYKGKSAFESALDNYEYFIGGDE